MNLAKSTLGIGLLALSGAALAKDIQVNITGLEFGGWMATEYSHNFDDSPYDLGFNSNASRIFLKAESQVTEDIVAFGKIEYAIAFSDANDNEFNTRLGYVGLHTKYGSIEAGKVWSPFYDIAMYSDTIISHKDTATGAFYAPASEIGGFGRADNSLKYYNSFPLSNGKIMVGAIVGDQNDEQINTNVTVNSTYGGSLRYAQDGFQFGIAQQVAQADGLADGDDNISATIVGGMYNSPKFMIGGNYTIGKNNQNDFGFAAQPSELVDSKAIEGFAHYRFIDSWKAYAGYNKLTTDNDNYITEFANVGIIKNFNKKVALYSEYRIDMDSTENSAFYGDALAVGMIYFFSDYPQYF